MKLTVIVSTPFRRRRCCLKINHRSGGIALRRLGSDGFAVLLVCEPSETDEHKEGYHWSLPGGKCCDRSIKEGKIVDCCSETPEQTLVREFKEETGYDVVPGAVFEKQDKINHLKFFFRMRSISTLLKPGVISRSWSTSSLSAPRGMRTMSWSIVAEVSCVLTEMRVGVRRNSPISFSTSLESVAEKKSVCRGEGRSERILRMSLMKPMSSMRSASSSTAVRKSPRLSARRSSRSLRRPGVPITNAGLRRSSDIWGLMLAPPTHTVP